MEDRLYYLGLNLIPGLGSILTQRLCKYFDPLSAVFGASESELLKIEGFGKGLAQRIVSFKVKEEIEKEQERMAAHKVSYLTLNDPEYPRFLRHIFDPPLVLYYKGFFSEMDFLSLAVIGSRRPTLYGKLVAQRLTGQIAGQGITVVSGMARGIDTMAHRGALRNKGRTIAVLGSGLDRIYPPENKHLMEEITAHGAVISEFPMGTPPYKQNFPIRNRIISGISLGVIVVEAGVKSGALITARLALEQGREVFAVPGPINSWASQGTNGLIKQGAKLVTDIHDILEELSVYQDELIRQVISSKLGQEKDLNKAVSEDTQINPILGSLVDGPKHIDVLCEMTGIPIGEILSKLVQFQMEGIVKQLPGNIYARV